MPKVSHDSETPAQGQQVISAVAFIHRVVDGQTEVFLPKRADTKKFLPGVYEMPGGHIDFGEDIVMGLEREIMEEFGMRVSLGDPYACFTYENKVKGSHSVEVVYFGTFIDPDDKIQINPEDHSTYGWFSYEQLLANKETLRASTDAASLNGAADDQDREFNAVTKGFELLSGKSLDFGQKRK